MTNGGFADAVGEAVERSVLARLQPQIEREAVERFLAGCAVPGCGDDASKHPASGLVRFEWAETARPEGWWYYRTADLQGESVLLRDHPFVSREQALGFWQVTHIRLRSRLW